MDNKIDFRQQIRTLIERKGISAAKLSRLVDLNSGTIYHYLAEESELTSGNLTKILETLNNLPDKKSS